MSDFIALGIFTTWSVCYHIFVMYILVHLGSKHIALYRKFFRRLDFNWGEMKNVPEVCSVCRVISSLAAGMVGCEIMALIAAESAFLVQS